MPSYNYHQAAFKNGMISKKLYGRTDIEEYNYSVKDMKNFLPAPMGGAFSRPGTVANILLSQTRDGYVIPWETSFGNFFLVYESQDPQTSTLNFRVFGIDGLEITHSSLFKISTTQTSYYSSSNMPTHSQLITQYCGNNFIGLDPLGFKKVFYGNSLILTHSSGLICPLVFTISQSGLNYACEIEPYLISSQFSVSSTTGSYYNGSEIGLAYKSTPYLINKSLIGIAPAGSPPGGQEGKQTTSAVNETLNATGNYFTSDMKWTFLVLNQANVEGVYFIYQINSATQALARVIIYGKDTSSTVRHRRQLFSPDLKFPKLVYSFNNRIMFANTDTKVNWFWASRTNDLKEIIGFRLFQDLTTYPITEVDSFELPVSSSEYEEIRWMSQQNDLLIGTNRQEYVLNQGENALSIVNIGISSQSSIGGSFVSPVRNSEAIFFVSSDGKTIRQVQYNFDVRGYRSKNILILNDDIIYTLRDGQDVDSLASVKITKIVWQESNRTLWVLTSLNNVFSITIEPSSTTIAPAYHVFGGNPEVIDIFTFFSFNLDRSVFGIVSKRSTLRYVELMPPEYLNEDLLVVSNDIGDQPIFMDMCALISTPQEASSIGLFILPSGGVANSIADTNVTALTNKYPTGKKFVITTSIPDVGPSSEPRMDVGQFLYLINSYDGYGYPKFSFADTPQDALDGIPITFSEAFYRLELDDAEPTAKYSTWGPFNMFKSKTVDVIADEVLIENVPVNSGGMFTLSTPVQKVVLGYRFESRLETMTPETTTREGSSQGDVFRARKAYVRYYKSRTASVGSRDGNIEPVVFPEVPFTGAINTFVDSSTDREYSIILKKEKSLPLNVMSITFRGSVD